MTRWSFEGSCGFLEQGEFVCGCVHVARTGSEWEMDSGGGAVKEVVTVVVIAWV